MSNSIISEGKTTTEAIEKGYNAGWVPYKRKSQKLPQRKQKHYHKTR